MNITATKLTDIDLMHKACEATMHGKQSNLTLLKAYSCQHSVIRTQVFFIEMLQIPTFVSVHLVRHSIGITHFVTSNREDRGGSAEVNRMTPVNHSFICNAESLINMARKRLCGSTHLTTRETMAGIKDAVSLVDLDLSKFMVRECEYRNGLCAELRTCGRIWPAGVVTL